MSGDGRACHGENSSRRLTRLKVPICLGGRASKAIPRHSQRLEGVNRDVRLSPDCQAAARCGAVLSCAKSGLWFVARLFRFFASGQLGPLCRVPDHDGLRDQCVQPCAGGIVANCFELHERGLRPAAYDWCASAEGLCELRLTSFRRGRWRSIIETRIHCCMRCRLWRCWRHQPMRNPRKRQSRQRRLQPKSAPVRRR